MPTTVRQALRRLQKDGWYVARTRGSHRQLRHDTKSGTVTVAGKESAEIPPGTLKSIYRQAGIDE